MDLLDRYRGALTGLAAGDALGTTIEFNPPGSFKPVTDIVGGGPFALKAGQWTDDTSMALCLAKSLIERKGFDAEDQLRRYLLWFRNGHLSSTGRCFDIGRTVRSALNAFEGSPKPYCGATHPETAGNGSIMRLAPVPMFFLSDPAEAVARSGESSRTTHGAEECIDACRYLGGLIVGALQGRPKKELLAANFSPAPDAFQPQTLSEKVREIAAGSFKLKQPPAIKGTGYVVRSLEAALWAFHHSESFSDGCLKAVNLGDDADTTGAVYGQLAGACYGFTGIPAKWRSRLALNTLIIQYAERLHALAGVK